MTLRRRLGLQYAVVVAVSLLLLAGLAHHEFIVEPRMRQRAGLAESSGSHWREYAELVFHALIPAVLGSGWWLMGRTVAPITTLARQFEGVHLGNLRTPLPRTAQTDEVDRLTDAFNGLTARLDASFQQIREFLLQASHELKTPLTVMRAQLETALRDAPGTATDPCGWMRGQLDELERLARIVDTLTLLSKADAGLVKLEQRLVPFDVLVRESSEEAALLAEPSGVQVDLAACARLTVRGDRDRLRQLLLNLVDNAAKYNLPGGHITLALRPVSGMAELSIANTGPGISPEVLPRVMDRFVRGVDGQNRGIEGAGLGLAICRWIVQAHGGTIRVTSEPGVSTTVTVRLPLAPVTQSDAGSPDEPNGVASMYLTA